MPDTRDLGKKEHKLKRRRKVRAPGWRKLKRKVRRLRGTKPNAGPDVSSFQGNIDWNAVADFADFALIKITEGRTVEDPNRLKNSAAAAKTEGLLIAPYHFAHPDNNDPRIEARHFVATARQAGFRLGHQRRGLFRRTELPGVLDYEVADPQRHDDKWIADFVDEYQKLTGQKPIIYGGSVLSERTTKNFGCRLWRAAYQQHYDAGLNPHGWWKIGPTFWQYTDGQIPNPAAGPKSCPGIGPCDMSLFRGTRRELLSLAT